MKWTKIFFVVLLLAVVSLSSCEFQAEHDDETGIITISPVTAKFGTAKWNESKWGK